MTLATRCSACGTSFRVVQDQLKVSNGWVRCGRCNEVFNALEGLYEIYTQPGELPAPPPRQDTVAAALDSPVPDLMGQPFARVPPIPHAPAREAPRSSHAPAAPAATSTSAVPWTPASPPAAFSAAPSEGLSSDPGHTVPQAGYGQIAHEAGAADFAPSMHVPDDVETRLEPRVTDDGAAPSFMLPPRVRRARRTSAAQLAGWSAVAGVLILLAAGQSMLAYRDVLAAYWPAARPTLSAVCSFLGCKVEPLRRMAALSVEGSNLRQRSIDANYDLIVNLRNRSELALMLPAFELTLTDTQGQPLVRRVLQARELGAAGNQIAGGADLSLQSVLDVNDRRIAGYTIEIFYP